MKRRTAPNDAETERLKVDFKDRYHHFKLLLNANNQALQKMADIEQGLQGRFSFGMAFVRDRCTSVSVNVLQMIRHLERLAPQKYSPLHARFTLLNQQINEILSLKKRSDEERLVIPLDAVDENMAGLVGNKMAMLGEVKNKLHLHVPEGFAVTTHAYERFLVETGLRDEINRLVQTADINHVEGLYALSIRIRQKIIQSDMPSDIAEAIQGAWKNLETRVQGPLRVAMRSSALGEDAEGSSFAGQYNSELNVGSDDLLDTYKRVIASKYSLQAMTYRLNRGFRDEETPMAVGCLQMIDAVAGGVIYSRDPIDSKQDAVLINSVWGLAKTVVDGAAPCDSFVLSRRAPHEVIQEKIGYKGLKYACCDTDSGLCRENIDKATAARASLYHGQQTRLAEIALLLEDHNGYPQDIEWAIGPDGNIYILQSRALHQKQVSPDNASASFDGQENETVIIHGGITASAGAACGEVFVVEKHADAIRFPKGAVLVTRQALPAWAALLNRAVAVVTAQGGVAGHLASVAREFDIPALFGLEADIEKLVHGMPVTVDADHRKIYAGCVQALIDPNRSTPRISPEQPVYRLLKRASDLIVPLNLLDPDGRDFVPEKCRTYHDMTRFIHEKSVLEMFNFGKDHSFPERSGKQLYYHVPMQWWVLNLDDGFKEEVTGKYVRLENILSIPMLAFWKGFAAVPWDGPPAIDRRGLVSVMFQSTTNPALVTGVRSRYAEQNYFMISKHFCSLNSRLGYHFSTLETLVSDRDRENYISFQFKGGAADHHRRTGRAVFIGDILECYGFWVKIREDHLGARLEQENLAYMNERLAILGYLTLHTRQLDMIMNNSKQVAYYQAKLKDDIDKHILEG